MPCEFVLIVRASVTSGDDSDICTRRIARPPSALTTFPFMDAVPFGSAEVSRVRPCAGMVTVADWARGAMRARTSEAVAIIIVSTPEGWA